MKCPACNDVDLVMADRAGVEIDYCPKCRGVWLDRGELDKIIEFSTAEMPGRNLRGRGFDDDGAARVQVDVNPAALVDAAARAVQILQTDAHPPDPRRAAREGPAQVSLHKMRSPRIAGSGQELQIQPHDWTPILWGNARRGRFSRSQSKSSPSQDRRRP